MKNRRFLVAQRKQTLTHEWCLYAFIILVFFSSSSFAQECRLPDFVKQDFPAQYNHEKPILEYEVTDVEAFLKALYKARYKSDQQAHGALGAKRKQSPEIPGASDLFVWRNATGRVDLVMVFTPCLEYMFQAYSKDTDAAWVATQ